MNKTQNNPQLDQFISSKLKNLEIEFEQQVWLEMEDSLGAQTKGTSIPKINPKYIMASAATMVVGIGLFFLVRSITNQNKVDEQQALADSSALQVLQTDSVRIISEPVVSAITDSALTDTAKKTMAPIDTVVLPAAQTATAVVQSNAEKLLSEKKSTAAKETSGKEKKKTKTSSLAPTIADTGYVPEIIIPPDTSQNKSERKTETSPASSDTSKATNPSPKKSGKKGKQKSSPAEPPKSDSAPSEAKSDSLK